MCLLTFMHEGVTADIEQLTCGAENNPDGFGFAVHAGNRIIRGNGLNFDHVLDSFLKARSQHSGPALFHSRITTHGATSRDNCHPFQVGRDTLSVVAHNGMLPINESAGKSDTRIFAETLFPSWGGVRTLTSKKMRKKLSKFASGSKLVFLTADPDLDDFYIINEKDGHWDKGVWWSNSSYKWSRYAYSGGTGGMYTSGWSRLGDAWDYDDDDEESILLPAGSVIDCSHTSATGDEVWAEVWRCAVCSHEEYIDEDSINSVDFCPVCDCCWFCTDDRVMCRCLFAPQSDALADSKQPTLFGYDASMEMGTM